MELLGKIAKYVVPLAVSAALVVWLFHKVNIHQVGAIIKQGVDYRFLFIMMGITVLSHIIRGVRWGIQLRAAGIPRIPVVAESVSIFGAYALNMVFPFLGEAWRCVYISKREKCKISTVVGTDLGDRGSDAVMIGLFILLTLFVAQPALHRFIERYPIGESLMKVISDGSFWTWFAVVAAALTALVYIFRHTPFIKGIGASAKRIWDGFKVLFHMKGTGLYILLTLGIWICYFFETYVCFFAFPFTRELVFGHSYFWGIVPGLVVFVFGSCSMAIPSNGGLGPWNLAVIFALQLYGIGYNDAAAYSILCWSFQAIILIASGIFSVFYIMADNKKLRMESKNRPENRN